jgi:hypothetical protein
MDTDAKGCGYRGFEFGGGYLDAACLGDGYLWDLDSDDADGMLTHGGEFAGVPCPKCSPEAYCEWSGCDDAERQRRVDRAFGPTPWVPSKGPTAEAPR